MTSSGQRRTIGPRWVRKIFSWFERSTAREHYTESPMTGYRCGSKSITGNYRDNNEDSFVVDEQGRFFIVADGMGGQCAGEKASAMAIELVPKQLTQLLSFRDDSAEKVVSAIDDPVAHENGEIMALGEDRSEFRNMGTTVAFVVHVGATFFVGGVGDSRVYLLRNGHFTQLTTDHSLTQALLDAGTITHEEAANHRYKNVLYRYLGTREGGTGTQPRQVVPEPGDRLFLCSDGVTDGIDDETLRMVLEEHPDPQEAADACVKSAQDGGSKDNITCIVLDVT